VAASLNLSSAGVAAGDAAPLYLAATLDRQGKLDDALLLYGAQAEKSRTQADRLRYAGALLRAGRADEAKGIYDDVSREAASVEHGGSGVTRGAALCASSLLANGFPSLALPYAWQAHRLSPNDPTRSLLLVRALAASGDTTTARATLAEVAGDPRSWLVGQRIELARWQLLTGDTAAAGLLLDANLAESVSQMFRDSILANVSLREKDWGRAAELLIDSERKVPPSMTDKRVDRAWRNAQRELWWVQLRQAMSLWKSGKFDSAVAAAARAEHSDEEYVHSAAQLLLVAADLAHGERSHADLRLQALAGHDPRFASAAGEIRNVLPRGDDATAVARRLQEALASLDRSADFVTQPVCEIVTAVPRKPGATMGRSGR